MSNLALRLRGPAIPVDLTDVAKQPTGAAAISLCAQKSGKLDKVIADRIGAQEAVWSRAQTTGKGLSLEQIAVLMEVCGNRAPLDWLLLRLNLDPHSLRPLESETDKKLREAEERIAELEQRHAVTVQLLREVRA